MSPFALPRSFSLTFPAIGTGTRREGIYKRLHRSDDAGGTDLNTVTATAVPLPAEVFRDADYFEGIGSVDSEIRVLRHAIYEIRYAITLRNTDAANPANVRIGVTRNGSGGFLEGSSVALYLPPASLGTFSSGIAHGLDVDVDIGDYLEIKGIQLGAFTGVAQTLADSCHVQVRHRASLEDDVLGGRISAPRSGVMQVITVSKNVSGDTGTTVVDVLRDGVSIFPTSKLVLLPSESVKLFPVTPYLVSDPVVRAGEEYTIQVIDAETPPPLDLVVQVRCIAWD